MLKLCKKEKDFLFILDNLRDEDYQELNALWGSSWKENTLNGLKNAEVLVLYGKNSENKQIPIDMGGFYEQFDKSSKIACVWLLTTKYIKYNKSALMRVLKEQIELAETKYSLMYNHIYKANIQAKLWLRKLGFCFDNPKPKALNVPKDFEFFYKIIKRKEY